jgi:hypothetical protein
VHFVNGAGMLVARIDAQKLGFGRLERLGGPRAYVDTERRRRSAGSGRRGGCGQLGEAGRSRTRSRGVGGRVTGFTKTGRSRTKCRRSRAPKAVIGRSQGLVEMDLGLYAMPPVVM